jgi:L-lysine 6-oxidase
MPDKFLTLTETQYFLLSQWADGKFVVKPMSKEDIPTALSRAAVGNCVGGPFCPGIEVTWSTRNPNIYSAPFCIRHRHLDESYLKGGLSIEKDETAPRARGCEAGDLTKRMAIPWQADFFQCSIQYINFTDHVTNESDQIPAPPAYYTYWWPPQSPWVVITGDLDAASQQAAGTPAGLQVLYTRGINTFAQMISSWSYMGFVVNVATDAHRGLFPYFVEQERNHGAFIAAAVAIGDAGNVTSGEDTNFSNAWFLPKLTPAMAATRAPVAFATSRRQGRVAFRK